MKVDNNETIVVNGVKINPKMLELLSELNSKVNTSELKSNLFHALSMIATHSEQMGLGNMMSDLSQSIYFVYVFIENLEDSFEVIK